MGPWCCAGMRRGGCSCPFPTVTGRPAASRHGNARGHGGHIRTDGIVGQQSLTDPVKEIVAMAGYCMAVTAVSWLFKGHLPQAPRCCACVIPFLSSAAFCSALCSLMRDGTWMSLTRLGKCSRPGITSGDSDNNHCVFCVNAGIIG